MNLMLSVRALSFGRARGNVLLSKCPVSFLSDIDPKTGKFISRESNLYGKSLRGRILVFPHGKACTAAPYILLQMKTNMVAPVAMLTDIADTSLVSGALITEIPMVDMIDISLLRNSDTVTVDSVNGTVTIPGLKIRDVVTSILVHKRKVLILKRSRSVGTYRGFWSGVSGYLEKGEKPLRRAYAEVFEETRIEKKNLTLIKKGKEVLARDEKLIWRIRPFLFKTRTDRIRLDWEHTHFQWINPKDIVRYNTVPKLKEIVLSFAGLPARSLPPLPSVPVLCPRTT